MNSRHFVRYTGIACGLLLCIAWLVISRPSQGIAASGEGITRSAWFYAAQTSGNNPANIIHAKGFIYVDHEATGAGNGSTWADAFTLLQPALEAATSGDQIWVAAGTYKPTVAHGGAGERYKSFQLKNGVALYGGFDPSTGDIGFDDRDWVVNVTILSGDLGVEGDLADNSYHVFFHPQALALDSTAVLDGFTIADGNADQIGWPHFAGGGMYNDHASPTLSNCSFSGNAAYEYGAGIYNYYASPTITNCIFTGNTADIGAGMSNNNSTTTLTDCTFQDNTAFYAGGMYNYASTLTLIRCIFVDNTANGGVVAGDGGAIYNQTSEVTLTDCNFSGNSAVRDGGGIFNDESSPVLTNVTFANNTAGQNAGGLYNRDASSPKVINTIFFGNQAGYYGGAMYSQVNASPVLTNCTFFGNSSIYYQGGGVYGGFSSTTTLINSILWGDSPDEINSYDPASAPVATHSDVQGGYAGDGNIDMNPSFVDAINGDFHLGPFSPCIDQGDNAALDLPPFDFEGDTRIMDGNGDGIATVDMGVDESLGGAIFFRFYLPTVLNSY